MVNKKAYDLGNTRSEIRELFEFGLKRKAEIGAENVFDFSLGNPSIAPPSCVNESVLELIRKNPIVIHGYTSAAGDLSVRKTIAASINKRFAVGISENLIYMTAGAAASLTITLKAIAEKDFEVVVLAPYFPEYKVFIEAAGMKTVISEPDENMSIDFANLKDRINGRTKAIIVNSPNNPSGVVYTEKVIKRLAEVLSEASKQYKTDIFLIADEPYRELVYDGEKVPYLMNYYDNSVVCYSYSKVLSLAGERIGYIAINPKCSEAKELYLAVCGAGRALGYVCAPSLFQRVVAACEGSTANIEEYKENRDILLNALREYGYECVEPRGAFYLFVKALEPDARKFSEKARDRELLLVASDSFGVKGYVRISYCVSKTQIVNSLPAFAALIKDYKGKCQ